MTSQDLEKGVQLCSRVARGRNVPHPGKTCPGRSGWAGEKWLRLGLGHCRLTISPARPSMASLIRDAVRLAAAALGRLFEHPGGILRAEH